LAQIPPCEQICDRFDNTRLRKRFSWLGNPDIGKDIAATVCHAFITFFSHNVPHNASGPP
jgi:hypothetical protein